MSVLCQEHEIIDINDKAPADQEDFQDASLGFNLLRLDSFTGHRHHDHRHPPCASCGCSGSFLPPTSTATTTINPPSSCKRRSPDSPSPTMDPQDQQQHPKKPKKLFTDPTETTTSAASLRGFSKIPLPFNLSVPSNSAHVNNHPLLRRCSSDPTTPPVAGPDSSGTSVAPNGVPQSPPENAKAAGANGVPTPASKGSASLPPRPLSIRRTVSDPSPSKSFSQSSSCNDDEASNYQWLKKMRDCMKQMSQWWDEYMPDEVMGEEEEEEENKATEENSAKDDSVTEFEEAVSVERAGECFIINFKCPCGKGYQILISGMSCFYKLL